ncbi:hypothetical protein HHK36_033362 [Tetracentron sinense]|uniref:EF-hand domain-containing protein n=1 Tax=Tetracentron sinense TaxID=13715 RepID=A0A835CYS9_TETSI|nr:hypothetical protein HHK36_033362 [Tetracentron sinense]
MRLKGLPSIGRIFVVPPILWEGTGNEADIARPALARPLFEHYDTKRLRAHHTAKSSPLHRLVGLQYVPSPAGRRHGKSKHAEPKPPLDVLSLRCPSLNCLRLRRIFDVFDKNGDAMITIDELSQALDLLGLEAEASELDSTVQKDSDLSEAFNVFDEDGDGFISAKELQVVLGKLGLQEGREIARVQQMICSVDRNHDGRVDFLEFKDMMQSVLVRSSERTTQPNLPRSIGSSDCSTYLPRPADAMEKANTRSLSHPSTSFRLRCPSLNCLRLRRIFDVFDKNGDAMITIDELSQALDLLGLEAEASELDSTVQSYIKKGNTGLEFDDFVALHQSLGDTYFGCDADADATVVSQEDSDLSEAFNVFDEDGDGFISAKELQVVLGKLGLQEGREIARVQQMICSVDRNHDGRVDFLEFKDMMQSVLVRSS